MDLLWNFAQALGRAAVLPLRLVGRALRLLGTLLLALVLLFEEWGWRPLAELLSLLARFRLWARVEGWISSLPPYGALVVFALPSLLLLPVKLGAFWLLAHGKVLWAGGFLAGAKVVSTALVARILLLTKPALMQLRWFAGLHDWLMPWKEAIFARIRASWVWRYGRMLKTRAKQAIRRVWGSWRPYVRTQLERLLPRLARLRWVVMVAGTRVWQKLRAVLRL
jgi:hypothetical protein